LIRSPGRNAGIEWKNFLDTSGQPLPYYIATFLSTCNIDITNGLSLTIDPDPRITHVGYVFVSGNDDAIGQAPSTLTIGAGVTIAQRRQVVITICNGRNAHFLLNLMPRALILAPPPSSAPRAISSVAI
jgi:hypothetical protein